MFVKNFIQIASTIIHFSICLHSSGIKLTTATATPISLAASFITISFPKGCITHGAHLLALNQSKILLKMYHLSCLAGTEILGHFENSSLLPQEKILFLRDHVEHMPPLPSLFLRKDFSLIDRVELYRWGFCASDSDKMFGRLALKQMPSGPCVISNVSSQISIYVTLDLARNKEQKRPKILNMRY